MSRYEGRKVINPNANPLPTPPLGAICPACQVDLSARYTDGAGGVAFHCCHDHGGVMAYQAPRVGPGWVIQTEVSRDMFRIATEQMFPGTMFEIPKGNVN